MNTLKKFELMEKIVRELEDLQNSQQALIQKIGKIEVDNIELSDGRLEKDLPDVHQRIADNLETITGVLAYFATKTDAFADKNNTGILEDLRISFRISYPSPSGSIISNIAKSISLSLKTDKASATEVAVLIFL